MARAKSKALTGAVNPTLEMDDPVWTSFVEMTYRRGYARRVSRAWFGNVQPPVDITGVKILLEHRNGAFNQESIIEEADCLVYLRLRGDVGMTVSAQSFATCDRVIGHYQRLFPVSTAEDHACPVSFWMYGKNGPVSRDRRIAVPDWFDIMGNYTAPVYNVLGTLMAPEFRPDGGGQLILWRGEPGTGKTWALRALMWEWRKWATIHYVTDPETFFGTADYMMQVITADNANKWLVLILEDTGELLTYDAKSNVGQGLARLLNVVDGVIGQGLQVLVLVTTNEELGKLHPAVTRAGRCLAQIEFGPLTQDEARTWLREHGKAAAETESSVPRTLADLYAAVHGRKKKTPLLTAGLGFKR